MRKGSRVRASSIFCTVAELVLGKEARLYETSLQTLLFRKLC